MGVSVRQKDGKAYVFIRHQGERAAQQFESEEDAQLVAAAVRHAMALGQFDIAAMKKRREPQEREKPAAPPLSEFFKETMTPLWEPSLAKGTFARYETSFRIHILPVFGATPIHEITRDRVKDFVVGLLQKKARRTARHLAKDSIRNIVAALRAALNEAVERQLLIANPATRLGKLYREAGQVREEVDPFTAEEIPLLLDATQTHFGYDHYVLTLTAFHTGMRAGELAGLQWPDLDFRGRFITVRRQYKDGASGRTKQRKMRKVDISDVLLHELQTLKKRRKADYLARGKNEIPEWVFLSPGQIIWSEGKPAGRAEGQPVDMDNFRNRVFWKACDKANIRRRRLHDTRHTFASILLMHGESPVYVKEQLGHSSIKMTVDIYGHFIPGANRQAVNKLPSLHTAMLSKTAAD